MLSIPSSENSVPSSSQGPENDMLFYVNRKKQSQEINFLNPSC